MKDLEQLRDLLSRRELVFAKLKNGFGYLLTDTAIGHPLLRASLERSKK